MHAIYIEGFIEIAIASYLTLSYDRYTPFGESIAYGLSWFSICVYGIQVPISYIFILCKPRNVLKSDEDFN